MKFYSTILLLGSLFFFSCNEARWEVGDDFKELNIDYKRFDCSLLELSKSKPSVQDLINLEKEYPDLYPLYLEGIMRFNEIGQGDSRAAFLTFLNDKNIQELLDSVNSVFPLKSLEHEFSQISLGLSKYHYFFPKKQIPAIRTMISAFTFSVVSADSLLVIGLDNYLGRAFSLYPKVGVPVYLSNHFSKEYIVPDALKAWLISEFEGKMDFKLIDQMVFQGKILYLLKTLIPDIAQHLYFDYSEEELKWCEENEREVWAHFIQMELLFTDKSIQIRKYMGDAPFIPGFPEGSPGRVGQWVGYRIVESYMNENKKVSLNELMNISSSNKILQESRYKPQL